MPKQGLHLIKPSSIASTGSGNSSSINTNGSVTFTTCATLSLNGVFGADYDNYMIVIRCSWGSAGASNLEMRLRASGTDNSTASSYSRQRSSANGTSVVADKVSGDTTRLSDVTNTYDGIIEYIYGPYLTIPTVGRSVVANSSDGAAIYDYAWTHNQSIAYDGFTIYPNTVHISGLVCVYGMRN